MLELIGVLLPKRIDAPLRNIFRTIEDNHLNYSHSHEILQVVQNVFYHSPLLSLNDLAPVTGVYGLSTYLRRRRRRTLWICDLCFAAKHIPQNFSNFFWTSAVLELFCWNQSLSRRPVFFGIDPGLTSLWRIQSLYFYNYIHSSLSAANSSLTESWFIVFTAKHFE